MAPRMPILLDVGFARLPFHAKFARTVSFRDCGRHHDYPNWGLAQVALP